MKKKTAIVIGAGFAGLSIAALLGKEGYKVTVLEKNKTPGGRARVWRSKGSTFDMGPSWYLGPEIFEKFFREFGKKPADYYALKRLDPSYRIFFDQNEIIDISPNLDKNFKLFDSLEENGAAKLTKYLEQSKFQYDLSMEYFIYKEYKTLFDLFDRRMIKVGKKLNLFDSMDKFTNRYFSNDKTKKILQYTMVFLGGSPHNTPGMYAIMAHMDMNLGVWYPMGGFHSVVNALISLCKQYQVTIKTNTTVKKIYTKNQLVTGILTDISSSPFTADIVVSAADLHHTETKLLDKNSQSYPESYWSKKVISPSACIIYLGINKKIPKLTHHNLFLANDWENHFNAIFKQPAWHPKPSYYVSCPSKTDPTVAPPGMENIFVLVPVAPGIKDTDKNRDQYFNLVINHLQDSLGEKFEKNIVTKRIYSHRDFKLDYNAYKGTALGMAPTFFQSAYFRPNHKSKKIKNLYYTGLYNHPGTGVPMVLISSQIARDVINNDFP